MVSRDSIYTCKDPPQSKSKHKHKFLGFKMRTLYSSSYILKHSEYRYRIQDLELALVTKGRLLGFTRQSTIFVTKHGGLKEALGLALSAAKHVFWTLSKTTLSHNFSKTERCEQVSVVLCQMPVL